MGEVKVSFVVPAYNEEDSIGATLGTLDEIVTREMETYEIVLVDDGSKDKTLSKAIEYGLQKGHVTLVRYVKNMGKGYATRTGFAKARGEIVVFTDGDQEIDMHTISRYIDALHYGDIVIASKWHPDSQVKTPFVRKIMSCGFNVLVRLLTGVPFKDTQAGLKAMKKSVLEEIFPRLAVKRYAFDVELLAVSRLYGLKVVEMPVTLKLNASFKIREIGKMFIDLLGIAYRLRLIHWYQRNINKKNGLQHFVSLVTRDT